MGKVFIILTVSILLVEEVHCRKVPLAELGPAVGAGVVEVLAIVDGERHPDTKPPEIKVTQYRKEVVPSAQKSEAKKSTKIELSLTIFGRFWREI